MATPGNKDSRTKHEKLLDEVEQKIEEGRRKIEDTREQIARSNRLLNESVPGRKKE